MRTADPDRAFCSIDTAAARMQVSRRTIYNWIQRGLVDVVRTPSGRQRIYLDSLTRPVGPPTGGSS